MEVKQFGAECFLVRLGRGSKAHLMTESELLQLKKKIEERLGSRRP